MTNDDRVQNGSAADRQGVSLEWVVSALVFFNLLLICIVTAVGAILLNRVDGQSDRSTQAICAIVVYAEVQAENAAAGDPRATPPRPPNPPAAKQLERLADEMRDTGVDCPPRE